MPVSDHSAFSSGSPYAGAVLPAWLWGLSAALFSLAFAPGCTPKIGDSCTVSTNCSATGDRLCDITQPGGYCTVFNCEPGSCPEDSQCINFGTTLSPVGNGVCSPSQGSSPYQRSFCMASCGSNSDCREGYECRSLKGDAAHPNPLGAVLAEYSGDGMVCVVPWNPAPALAAGAGGGGAGGYTGDQTQTCTVYMGGAPNGGASNAGQGGG